MSLDFRDRGLPLEASAQHDNSYSTGEKTYRQDADSTEKETPLGSQVLAA
jgi:hypothetical protein